MDSGFWFVAGKLVRVLPGLGGEMRFQDPLLHRAPCLAWWCWEAEMSIWLPVEVHLWPPGWIERSRIPPQGLPLNKSRESEFIHWTKKSLLRAECCLRDADIINFKMCSHTSGFKPITAGFRLVPDSATSSQSILAPIPRHYPFCGRSTNTLCSSFLPLPFAPQTWTHFAELVNCTVLMMVTWPMLFTLFVSKMRVNVYQTFHICFS